MDDSKLDKVISKLKEEIHLAEYINESWKDVEVSLLEDALELLKKQAPKPVWYETNSMTGLPISHCPSCNEIIKQYAYGDIRKTYYCQYCGQAVKWE